MVRYTIKEAEKCFEMLLKVKGKRKARSYNDVGAWRLDYNPTYGGIVIEEINNSTGGVGNPMGYRRRSPRDFCDFVRGVIYLDDSKSVRVGSYTR